MFLFHSGFELRFLFEYENGFFLFVFFFLTYALVWTNHEFLACYKRKFLTNSSSQVTIPQVTQCSALIYNQCKYNNEYVIHLTYITRK